MTNTVIICAYTLERWSELSAAVQSCHDQSLQPDEIIVVIDHNDELLSRARDVFVDARVVPNTMSKGLSGARNTGVDAARGDVLAFLDDDAFAEHAWLEKLTEPFSDPHVAGVGGWILPHFESEAPYWLPETFYWVLGCSYEGLPPSGATIRNPIGASMAIRRHVFEAVGGFTAGLGRLGKTPLGGEETELCIRYGRAHPHDRFVLQRDAVVHHRVPPSRLTWHYFWARCWAEGLSKSAIASLVGTSSGLAAERRHVLASMPRALARDARSVVTHPRQATSRIAHLIAGTAITSAGFFWGRQQEHALTLERPASSAPVSATSLSIITLDLDDGTSSVESAANDRLWVELTRRGQVLGVLNSRKVDGQLPRAVLDEARATFEGVTALLSASFPDQLPSASIIVPTIGSDGPSLWKTVESLLALDYPSFEVLVVDNRPHGPRGPMPSLPNDPRVHVLEEEVPGISAARNRGLSAAAGEIVAFTDDDVQVDRNWLRALATRFVANPEVDAVSGLVLPSELSTAPQLWFEEFFGGFSKTFTPRLMSRTLMSEDPLFPYEPGRFGAGCNMAFRKSVFEHVGRFNTALGTGTPARGGEDLDMFTRIILDDRTVAFEPAALVRHTHRRREDAFFRQVFGYGTGLTAMYTAMIIRDPRHLIAMARRLPAGLRHLTTPREERSVLDAPSYPRRTQLLQLLGMAYGPLAYARSVVALRRAKETQDTASRPDQEHPATQRCP